MLKLYDTMTRRLKEIEPLEPGLVKMYTCGPTVYRDPHIGNYRSYLMADWVRRALEFQGITVLHVKNITDVGHMRQEALEQGGDKVIAEAIARGMTPQQIAEHYTGRFIEDELKLNIIPANHFPKATDHVAEMVAIVEELVERGSAYEAGGNVYFDVSEFAGYGNLSGNTREDALQEAVRIESDPLKTDPRDFTLWKLGEPGRDLVWDSPWGKGFPGWHIECTAMSMKYLGQRFDIHTGGVDNIFPHHEDELAQSEAFTGAGVVNTWLHGQHLLADGVKMSKSSGNVFTLPDIVAQGIEPGALRYLCMTAHLSTRLNFTFTSLKAAQRGLLHLQNRVWEWGRSPGRHDPPEVLREWEGRFIERVNDNLDMPGALAIAWDLAHSDLTTATKLQAMLSMDRVLGLGLDSVASDYGVAEATLAAVGHRSDHRSRSQYDEADEHRSALAQNGFVIEDGVDGTGVRPKTAWEQRTETWDAVSSSSEVDSFIDEPDAFDITVGIIATNYQSDVERAVANIQKWTDGLSVEVIAVDNGSTDGTSDWLEDAASRVPNLRVIHTDYVLGAAAARNIALKQARGRTIVMMDTSVEIQSSIFGPLVQMLDDPKVGVAGPLGLLSEDLQHFHDDERPAGDVDAMQAYCFAFRRSHLADVGLMRESFRFYRNLDIDYSFQFKDKGYRIVADPDLPIKLHEHRAWNEVQDPERDELSRKNFGRFLHKWGHRQELLVGGAHQS
jgi:cysteinyl-tRNA synthetase